ncbi:hypothetical protein CTI12_AA031380 [Artemisia annua]|uniref:Uncharacterized protein n=1 Tax=Artemisia annua TaxID=35608 RepID=A0A2U1QA67_ARTAN|nr:hypothetical protein CTI12_AA031380 [Artemisia annua]
MVGESSSKPKNYHKNNKKGGGSGQNSSKDKKKDYTIKRATTSRKFIIVGSVGNLVIKPRIVATRKSIGGGISGGIPTKQTMSASPTEFAGVIEAFLTTNDVDWWFDYWCQKHICNSRSMFVSYQKVNETEQCLWGMALKD